MKTSILYENDLSAAVSLLKKGEAVIFPTETVYGLGASLLNPSAIQRIYQIKGRPNDNPLIAHAASIEQALLLAKEPPPLFFRLAERFWPGPLTLVVERHPLIPAAVSAGHPTLAIRIPSHPIAQKLIALFGSPLAAPSANLSGKPSPTNLADALEDLDGRVEAAIDGGPCAVGIESTVLSLFHPIPTILRPGSITQSMLEEALQMKIALASRSEKTLSPGMKYRHYAPKAKLRLVKSEAELRSSFILSASSIEGSRFLDARNFYSLLREADRLGIAEIDILCDERLTSDAALMNRLLRAAGQL